MKKRFCWLSLVPAMFLFVAGALYGVSSAGDIDGDGKTGLQEAVYVLQTVAGMRTDTNFAGDLNGDGVTDLQDTIYTLKILAGISEQYSEALTSEQVQFLDNLPEMTVSFNNITLPNGENAKQFILENDPDFFNRASARNFREPDKDINAEDLKNLLIAKLFYGAVSLVGFDPPDVTSFVKQDKLAYSYGSKQYTLPKPAPAGINAEGGNCTGGTGGCNSCPKAVYGLDCSGFVYNVFKFAGLNLPQGTANDQRKEETLKNTLKGTAYENKLFPKDKGRIPVNEIKAGDIIYWKNSAGRAFHIGIVLSGSATGKTGLFMSHGLAQPTDNDPACDTNYGPKRGVRLLDVTAGIIDSNNWFGTRYGIVRFEAAGCSGPFANSLGMSFVPVQPGTFTMGSPSSEGERNSDETQHTVTLTKGFCMQTTEVTQGQWKAVMGSNPSYFSACGDNCPVETVSWYDVQDFISRLNEKGEGTYRLPTEAEWEYAARAGSTTAFANGGISGVNYLICNNDPNLSAMGWYCDNSGTHSVAQKQATAWGLYDMHGNVWEWCQDWYGDYRTGAVTDPSGPGTGSDRVIRGGGWYSVAVD